KLSSRRGSSRGIMVSPGGKGFRYDGNAGVIRTVTADAEIYRADGAPATEVDIPALRDGCPGRQHAAGSLPTPERRFAIRSPQRARALSAQTASRAAGRARLHARSRRSPRWSRVRSALGARAAAFH